MNVLFVCTANKLRSPTAEELFQDMPGLRVLSAGTDSEAPRPLTKELVEEADLIVVMEPHHRERIRRKYKKRPPDSRIVTLHIPDDYARNDPELVALLNARARPLLERFAREAGRD